MPFIIGDRVRVGGSATFYAGVEGAVAAISGRVVTIVTSRGEQLAFFARDLMAVGTAEPRTIGEFFKKLEAASCHS